MSLAETGFSVKGLDYSPIKGPEGNIEYLLYLQKSPELNLFQADPEDITAQAFQNLDTGGSQ